MPLEQSVAAVEARALARAAAEREGREEQRRAESRASIAAWRAAEAVRLAAKRARDAASHAASRSAARAVLDAAPDAALGVSGPRSTTAPTSASAPLVQPAASAPQFSLAARARRLLASSDIVAVELLSGLGGALCALAELAERGTVRSVRVPLAVDVNPTKNLLRDALARVRLPRTAAPKALALDVCDPRCARHAAKLAGTVDVLVSSIPCVDFSMLGKKAGMPAILDFLCSWYKVIAAARPRLLLVECVERLETADREAFASKIIAPLRRQGYGVVWQAVDADAWLPIRRSRLLIAARLGDAVPWEDAFDFPRGPDRRAFSLDRVLLAPLGAQQPQPQPRASKRRKVDGAAAKKVKPAVRPEAPASAYYVHRAAERLGVPLSRVPKRELAAPGRALLDVPFIHGKTRTPLLTYHFGATHEIKGRRTAKRVAEDGRRVGPQRGVAPTLVASTSGSLLVRDAHGARVVTGREVALLHGYDERDVQAFESVTDSSNGIASAVGDGFAVPVVRDVLRRMLEVDARLRVQE